jgi:hypothetical protein
MNFARRIVGSVRFWAYMMCLAALLVIAVPKPVEAACTPCGGNMCMFNNSCYAQYSTWCYNNRPFTCQYLGGSACPDVVALDGQCAQ